MTIDRFGSIPRSIDPGMGANLFLGVLRQFSTLNRHSMTVGMIRVIIGMIYKSKQMESCISICLNSR